MCTVSRVIMHIHLFCMFVYFDRVITLNTGDPHVCHKKVKPRNAFATHTEILIECCPDYVYQNKKCAVSRKRIAQENRANLRIACPAGKFGQDCSEICVPNYYGRQCKNICNCRENTKCDPIHGCICYAGFTGMHCLDVCPVGRYGVNCSQECFCAHDAYCDSVTGVCLCPSGWFGDDCSKECPFGKFGHNCSGTCDCSDDHKCDVVTGNCICNDMFYDYNYKGVYNCSETCECTKGAICNKQSGICQCTNSSVCFNIMKTSNINGKEGFYFNAFVIIFAVCVSMLVLTSFVLLGHWKNMKRQREQNNDQGHYHEIDPSKEIRDEDLQDMTETMAGIAQNNPTDLGNGFQLANEEHEYQNNTQSLPNICMVADEYINPYCSLQHTNDEYLNPYCALRFERRVKSCFL